MNNPITFHAQSYMPSLAQSPLELSREDHQGKLAQLVTSVQARQAELLPMAKQALKTGWEGAIPVDQAPLTGHYTRSAPLAVVGIDGSQINPQQGSSLWAYVHAVAVTSDAEPLWITKFLAKDELTEHKSGATRRDKFVQEQRELVESLAVAEAAQRWPERLILLDGPIPKKSITDPYLMQAFGKTVAGYVSGGGQSGYVTNLLRLAVGEWDEENRSWSKERITLFTDAAIMRCVLEPHQRSSLFRTNRKPVLYFYLRYQNEVARLEVPDWVGEETVDAIHSTLLHEQAGEYNYPLMAAHKLAAISQDQINQLQSILALEPGLPSAKDRFKLG
jgi:hypothetical protein